METTVGHTWLEIVRGDITRLDVDAIVVPTGADVASEAVPAGALKRTLGRTFDDSPATHEPIVHAVPGAERATQARWVILAAVTSQDRTTNAADLAAATTRSLEVAEALGAHSVALPALGAEAGGFPLYACADIILTAVDAYLVAHPRSRIGRVMFCASDAAVGAAFGHAMTGLWRSDVGRQRRL
jgi:O-acetyl-ADP-ribose deacetylase (regulator of RNase III)